jgi:hypothetical protein
MKTFLTAAILGITGLVGVAGAEAQDLRNYRNDRHDRRSESRYRHNDNRFTRRHAPRVERYWVPARYATICVGVDHCGRPIHRTVCVAAGYWATRPC